MSTPARKVTEAQALAWLNANPDATDEELAAFISGVPSVQRFGMNSRLVAAGRGASQTASFGLADEIVGSISGALAHPIRFMTGGPLARGQAISQGIDEERAINRELQENRPGSFLAGEIAGGVLQGVGAARAAPALLSRGDALATLLGRAGAANLPGRVAAQAATGAAGAGATAFGMAEGNPLERLPETALGAAAGGVIGAALPLAGAAGRAIGNATHIRPRMVNPARESDDLVNAALRKDNAKPAEMFTNRLDDPDVPSSILEQAGDHTRQLAVAAQARSNTARMTADDILEERAEQERNRYIKRLGETLNPEDNDIASVARELRDVRRANADKNFPAALEKSVEDVELARFFREPEVRRAYTEYRENQLTRAAAGLDADVPPEIYTFATNEAGKKLARLNTVGIPVKSFHVVQQAINDAVNDGFKNGKTIPKNRARALQDALERMHTKMPDDYQAARKVYRDDSSSIDALEAGLGKKIKNPHGRKIPNFSTATRDEMGKWLNDRRALAASGDEVAAADVENYLLGAFGFMRDKLNKRASTGDWLSLPATRERVRTLLAGDAQAADEFIRALRAERRIKPTGSVSRRGTSIAGDETVATPALDLMLAAGGAASGRPYATMASVGRLLRGEHSMSEQTANAVMQRLFAGAGGFDEFVQGMGSLRQAREAEIRRRARNVATSAAVGSAGAAVGSSVVRD